MNRCAERLYEPGPFRGHFTFIRSTFPRAGIADIPFFGWDTLAQGSTKEYTVEAEHTKLFTEDRALDEILRVLEGVVGSTRSEQARMAKKG